MPELTRAIKVQKIAAEFKFDWSKTQDIMKKIREETSEVSRALFKISVKDMKNYYTRIYQ